MMKYEAENERLKDTSRCANIRADLKMCLLESDCCKVDKVTPKECLKRHDATVPERCHSLKFTFLNCKRSLIDGRTRFRGPKTN